MNGRRPGRPRKDAPPTHQEFDSAADRLLAAVSTAQPMKDALRRFVARGLPDGGLAVGWPDADIRIEFTADERATIAATQ